MSQREQYVITSLSFQGDVSPKFGEPDPEQTPVGPFRTREAAWDYATAMMGRYGATGFIEVSTLHPPREEIVSRKEGATL